MYAQNQRTMMTAPKPGSPKDSKSSLPPDPLWYKDAIIYEVAVKSFFDGNDDGIGDFPGLIAKLDYIQSLGVNCIWLLPFYPSPLKDDGYDISDYEGIHPSYGTRKDFKLFVREAHRRGIRVITELVINHTSDQHPWFQRARACDPRSRERDFYVWSDTDERYKNARIIFTDTEKSNWTWDPVAKAYYWHRFFRHQPDLNFDNPLVVRAVMRIMRFWLDMGVDGLRLDAIPYLVEREGTACENLAETHAILKGLRAYLDAHYSGRMFLAEANQWPTDVLPYFGSGDECHMAFHFPLMPRLFMALRQEDRHPITEIIRQTPAIPDSCQWALFLRNHDELTLEMVTDEERDYMYYEYANDSMMRLNIGIRRRLTPLLDGSRQRLQLLASFLFSFPGTPIIYYGDEIGMGDNVYLGDRNGVRTPMQWTGDRNAGFSRADPARLYSPPVMDPVYGYQAVNVEAEERDPSSFLNWMKRMIALRKRLPVMSRGTMEVIFPQNRKVLAYVRRHEDQTVLAVANLSRFVQPAELDLRQFAGLLPRELIGGVEFPRIGSRPYFVTLAPHSFIWFNLEKGAVSGAPVTIFTLNDLPALTVAQKDGWQGIFRGNARRRLESEILPRYIVNQRWHSGKARKIISVRIADWGIITDKKKPSYFVVAEADYTNGQPESYLIPLAIETGRDAEHIASGFPQAPIARVEGLSERGLLYDAYRSEGVCTAIFDLIGANGALATQRGSIKATASSKYKEIFRSFDVLPFKSKIAGADQSNTSILYGERFILKMFRRLVNGLNPEFEIGFYLTDQAGFANVPRTGGVIEYSRQGEPKATLGVIHEYRENQGSGWMHALSTLGRFFELLVTLPREKPPHNVISSHVIALSKAEDSERTKELMGPYLKATSMLGKRTGEIHRALSENAEDPAFAPETLSYAEMQAKAAGMRDFAKEALRLLENNLGTIPESVHETAYGILSSRNKLLEKLKAPKMQDVEKGKIRLHGDFHLGQVLWVENDFIILDFEGEPSRQLAERREKQCVLKDVAGMLGSYEYAAESSLIKFTQDRPELFDRLAPWAVFWNKSASASFLRAYLAATEGEPFVRFEQSQFEALLGMFYLDKTFYELYYELNNRPDWVRIPLEKLASF